MAEVSLVGLSLDESLGRTDAKITLVQVMAWCRQATSHYLSQCWPRSMSPYGVTWLQWVKLKLKTIYLQHAWIYIQSHWEPKTHVRFIWPHLQITYISKYWPRFMEHNMFVPVVIRYLRVPSSPCFGHYILILVTPHGFPRNLVSRARPMLCSESV